MSPTSPENSSQPVMRLDLKRTRQLPASSMLKVQGTEISQRITEVAVEAAAYYGLPYQPHVIESRDARDAVGGESALTTSAFYFNNRAASIYGGSNEIQRNIIAKAVLGL